MISPKVVQVLLLLLFVSVVSVSTFVLLRRQVASLLQDLDGATPAPGRVTTTASPQSITPTTTLPPLTFVQVATDQVPVTPTSRSPLLAPPTPAQMGLVNSPVVNVRSAPSLAGEVVGQLKQGDRLEILATSPDGQWLQVCCPLGTGQGIRPSWVAAELIEIQP